MRRIAAVLWVCAALGGAACAEDTAEDAQLTQDTLPQAPGAQPQPQGQQAALPTIDVTLREWAVELSRDSIAAGPVTFRVRNTGTVAHAFEVEGGGQEWKTEELAPGAEVTMSVDLAAGEYKVYCPIAAGGTSHESRGMVTQLRVQ